MTCGRMYWRERERERERERTRLLFLLLVVLFSHVLALMARAALDATDGSHLLNCVHLAAKHMGQRAPHPNAACIIVKGAPIISRVGDSRACNGVGREWRCVVLSAVFADSRVISESVLYANGTKSPEEMALEEAGDAARGSVAYMNLEPGLCHGDNSSVRALIASGVKRAVIGIRNPLEFANGAAIGDLRNAGIEVSHE